MPAFSAGRVGHHIADERAVLAGQIKLLRQIRRDVLRENAKITARDLAAADEAFQDAARHVDGHGKTDALRCHRSADGIRC